MKRGIGDYLANELLALVVGLGIFVIIWSSRIIFSGGGVLHLLVSVLGSTMYCACVYVLLKPYANKVGKKK